MKVVQKSTRLRKIVDFFNFSEGIKDLLKIFILNLLVNHLGSCMFFFVAKFFGFKPTCWVV